MEATILSEFFKQGSLLGPIASIWATATAAVFFFYVRQNTEHRAEISEHIKEQSLMNKEMFGVLNKNTEAFTRNAEAQNRNSESLNRLADSITDMKSRL